jgi:hypothetical protein
MTQYDPTKEYELVFMKYDDHKRDYEDVIYPVRSFIEENGETAIIFMREGKLSATKIYEHEGKTNGYLREKKRKVWVNLYKDFNTIYSIIHDEEYLANLCIASKNKFGFIKTIEVEI